MSAISRFYLLFFAVSAHVVFQVTFRREKAVAGLISAREFLLALMHGGDVDFQAAFFAEGALARFVGTYEGLAIVMNVHVQVEPGAPRVGHFAACDRTSK